MSTVDEPKPASPKGAGVSYEQVDDAYFAARGLRRYARVWSLWALGVGAVISGDFFGWSFGLAEGGFGGLLIATLIITVMYLGLCFSIAEMSPALPHTGGAYSFARSAMGPWGGYVTGLAENMEYILTPAVIVVGIGSYLGAIFGTGPAWEPVWWLGAYAIFVGLNVYGVELSFKFTVLITLLALAILVVFYVAAIPHLDFARYAFDMPPVQGGSKWLPKGYSGVFGALPFAIWFYLAIEQLPLAAEEAQDPKRDMPKGIMLGLLTLIVFAFATLVVSAGIAPGVNALGQTDAPLYMNLQTIFGAGGGSKAFALIAVAGLVASFHSIIFAYGRQIYSMSRAGYFPRVLSRTGARKTPHVALIVGALIGYGVAYCIHLVGPTHPVGAVLLNMAVFGAVIAYALQMLSFVLLRLRLPSLERPYRSPLGVPGAITAAVIALATLVAMFWVNADYRRAVIGAAVWFVLGVAYFLVWGRHHLVYAPEEAFAVEARAREDAH
jgi:ethanolamine permease